MHSGFWHRAGGRGPGAGRRCNTIALHTALLPCSASLLQVQEPPSKGLMVLAGQASAASQQEQPSGKWLLVTAKQHAAAAADAELASALAAATALKQAEQAAMQKFEAAQQAAQAAVAEAAKVKAAVDLPGKVAAENQAGAVMTAAQQVYGVALNAHKAARDQMEAAEHERRSAEVAAQSAQLVAQTATLEQQQAAAALVVARERARAAAEEVIHALQDATAVMFSPQVCAERGWGLLVCAGAFWRVGGPASAGQQPASQPSSTAAQLAECSLPCTPAAGRCPQAR